MGRISVCGVCSLTPIAEGGAAAAADPGSNAASGENWQAIHRKAQDEGFSSVFQLSGGAPPSSLRSDQAR